MTLRITSTEPDPFLKNSHCLQSSLLMTLVANPDTYNSPRPHHTPIPVLLMLCIPHSIGKYIEMYVY